VEQAYVVTDVVKQSKTLKHAMEYGMGEEYD